MAAETWNHIPGVIAALQQAAHEIIVKTSFDVEAHAKQGAAVDTGYMRSSIYTVTSEGSGYGQGVTGGKPGATLLPEVDAPENATTAYVAVGAEYAAYVELGTVHQAAQPFMVPAADAVRPGFVAAWHALEKRLADVK